MTSTNSNPAILPTENEGWGLWGTSISNGYDAALVWEACSRFFQSRYGLTAEQSRYLMDARFGRHLADDLSFITGGPTTAEAITAHLEARAADTRGKHGWGTHYRDEARRAKAAVAAGN